MSVVWRVAANWSNCFCSASACLSAVPIDDDAHLAQLGDEFIDARRALREDGDEGRATLAEDLDGQARLLGHGPGPGDAIRDAAEHILGTPELARLAKRDAQVREALDGLFVAGPGLAQQLVELRDARGQALGIGAHVARGVLQRLERIGPDAQAFGHVADVVGGLDGLLGDVASEGGATEREPMPAKAQANPPAVFVRPASDLVADLAKSSTVWFGVARSVLSCATSAKIPRTMLPAVEAITSSLLRRSASASSAAKKPLRLPVGHAAASRARDHA